MFYSFQVIYITIFSTIHTSNLDNYLKYETGSESRKHICLGKLIVFILRLRFLFWDLWYQSIQFNQTIGTRADTGQDISSTLQLLFLLLNLMKWYTYQVKYVGNFVYFLMIKSLLLNNLQKLVLRETKQPTHDWNLAM